MSVYSNSLKALGESGYALELWEEFLKLVPFLELNMSEGIVLMQKDIQKKICVKKVDFDQVVVMAKYIEANRLLKKIITHVKNASKLTNSGFGDDCLMNFLETPQKTGDISSIGLELTHSINYQLNDFSYFEKK